MIAALLAQAAESANPMLDKLGYIVPEIVLFVAAVVVMIVGGSSRLAVRVLAAPIVGLSLVIAGAAAWFAPELPGSPLPGLMVYGKVLIAAVGVLLTLLMAGTIDREYELEVRHGRAFETTRSNRGEFYAFMLFSLTGLMLCTSADDLIWLFLALELTSLPTYIMVSISTPRGRSQEAGVKYFFLGAFGAATFLFGFALLYGAAGTTLLFGPEGVTSVSAVFAERAASGEGLGTIATLGAVLALLGIGFKIAAVPMHFYTPDVYEGAATPVSAFLAFVPKLAGFVAMMLLVSAIGWQWGEAGDRLPEAVHAVLWAVAALTMTAGNALALLQTNVKRMLAYSSVAHSGYMMVGVLAGPAVAAGAGDGLLSGPASNGFAAVLFYMLAYGFTNLGAFAVLACLERRRAGSAGEEIETIDDLRGLCGRSPVLGWSMVLCSASLLGVPPLLGFVGKLFLFTSGISAGEYVLVIVLGVNSAAAALYYLRLIATPLLEDPEPQTEDLKPTPFGERRLAAALSAASAVALLVPAGALLAGADKATRPAPPVAPAGEDEASPTGVAEAEAERTNDSPTPG